MSAPIKYDSKSIAETVDEIGRAATELQDAQRSLAIARSRETEARNALRGLQAKLEEQMAALRADPRMRLE